MSLESNISLFGAMTWYDEKEMLDALDRQFCFLGIEHKRYQHQISFHRTDKDENTKSDVITELVIRARPFDRSYIMHVQFPFSCERFPHTAAWLLDNKNRKYFLSGAEANVLYRISKNDKLIFEVTVPSSNNMKHVLVTMLGAMDDAIKTDWPEFKALAAGDIPESAMRIIHPVIEEVESYKTYITMGGQNAADTE